MTAKERAQIATAIELLFSDDGFDDAMSILKPLAGMSTERENALGNAKPVNIADLVIPQERTGTER